MEKIKESECKYEAFRLANYQSSLYLADEDDDDDEG